MGASSPPRLPLNDSPERFYDSTLSLDDSALSFGHSALRFGGSAPSFGVSPRVEIGEPEVAVSSDDPGLPVEVFDHPVGPHDFAFAVFEGDIREVGVGVRVISDHKTCLNGPSGVVGPFFERLAHVFVPLLMWPLAMVWLLGRARRNRSVI